MPLLPLSLCFHLPPLLGSGRTTIITSLISSSLHLPVRYFAGGLHHLSFITTQSAGCQLSRLSLHRLSLPLSHCQSVINRRSVLVYANFNSGGGGGGGGGRNDSSSLRVLGNLALALGLTYLTLNGQLGWILDAIVSIWLLAVLLPVLGLGVFLWWAGRDIIQDACPNCGNNFQIFKSSIEDGVQLCPFCTQPFSVQGSKFVRESARYTSNPYESSSAGFSQSKRGNTSPGKIIDIEAEMKDAD